MQLDQVVDRAVQVLAAHAQVAAAGQLGQVVEQPAHALGLAADQLGVAREHGLGELAEQELGRAADAAQRVAQLVRDARRELRKELRARALAEQVFQLEPDRAVGQREHDARDLAPDTDR